MNGMDSPELDERLRRSASHLRYPPTPSLAPSVMTRIPARAVQPRAALLAGAILAVVLAAVMLVPPARAAVLDFIQIGVVRIFRLAPAPAPLATPAIQAPVTATPLPASGTQAPAAATAPSSLQDIGGETTLADAVSRTGFPILLPLYPADLGQPDRVYLQNLGGSLLLLVWLQPGESGQVRMSLQEIAPGSWALTKSGPQALQEVSVNGHPGIWATGPYLLETRNRDYVTRQLVEGNALIWTQADVTYRLESGLSLEQALKTAESLEPLP